MAKEFGRPPSSWITQGQKLSASEQMVALDLDAACLVIGREAEHEAYEAAKKK